MDEYDCDVCGYVQNKGIYHGVRRQRFNDHLLSHTHKLKYLILRNNGLQEIKKMKEIKVPSDGGCAICQYHPKCLSSYNFLMKRHMVSKGHFAKISELNSTAALSPDISKKLEQTAISKAEVIPRFSMAKPTSIETYKNELANLVTRGDFDQAIIVRQKIDLIENSQNFFKLVNAK